MDNFISPDQIRSIFKLSFQEPTLGERKLGKRLGLSHSTIGKYKKIAKEANCSAEIVMQMDDEDLKQLFNLQSRKANLLSLIGMRYESTCKPKVIGGKCCQP